MKKKDVFKITVTAVVVIMIGINILFEPIMIGAKTIVKASDSRMMESPDADVFEDHQQYRSAYEAWQTEMDARSEKTTQAMLGLSSFYKEGSNLFLSTEKNENKIWSPVNAYIGLAMTTELTEGETKQQILNVFGVESTDELREQVSAVWENVYQETSKVACILANSLWLESGLQYNQKAMDALAYHYYASVYQGDLGSDKINRAIETWINNNTDGFLKDNTKAIELPQESILALYSTLYFQAEWSYEFSERDNTKDVFHMQDGDIEVVYMNKELSPMNYYWGENFSAVSMGMKNGGRMWFILPDEGMTTSDVLNEGTYMEMLLSEEWEDYKYMEVNLSVPKFDVSSTMDLSSGLKDMGIINLFDKNAAEFTNLTSDVPIYLTGANQSVRVEIDEKGVKAAAYIELPGAGSAAPPAEIIDFVVDRPFLFAITKDNVPLFMGCVNNPEC